MVQRLTADIALMNAELTATTPQMLIHDVNINMTTDEPVIKVKHTAGNTTSYELYYQEAVQVNSVSGIWAAPQSIDIWYRKEGNFVQVEFKFVLDAATSDGNITLDNPLPASIHPAIQQDLACVLALDNGNNLNGLVRIGASGSVTIYASAGLEPFTGDSGGGNSGFNSFGVTYRAIP